MIASPSKKAALFPEIWAPKYNTHCRYLTSQESIFFLHKYLHITNYEITSKKYPFLQFDKRLLAYFLAQKFESQLV